MSEHPWLTILGLGEDGPKGLTSASHAALNSADIVVGPARHLALLPQLSAEMITWPVPFSDGLEPLLSYRGKNTVMLASGDPFWFGAGSVVAKHLDRSEWRAIPGVSCFSLAASRLGWQLEKTECLGLHAAPLSRLRPHLAPGARLIVTLRDASSPAELATYLDAEEFGKSQLYILQSLAGPDERITTHSAGELAAGIQFAHPLCVAIEVRGDGAVLSRATGLADNWFDHDGQITKRPVRAWTLSTLAPCQGEHLWDIGGGSGSIAVEWLLAHPDMQATTIESNSERAKRIEGNAKRLGVDRLVVLNAQAPAALEGLSPPDAVFVGGGLSSELFEKLEVLASGARLVANAVTLESEAFLIAAQASKGGDLSRMTLSAPEPLGSKRGWKSSYPILQWSVVL